MNLTNNKMNGTQEFKTVLNEAELAYFEALIKNKKEEAQQELEYLMGTLEDIRTADDNDSSSIDHHMSDMGSIEESLDLTNRLIERNIKFIRELDRALVRIENGTYGICRATGQPIEKGRLEFAPHTRYSIAAKNSGLDKRIALA
ncbi:MAG: molecular chaperone DnaK [Balneolaceae bacterium]|nr:MAG: molecular chaperone DnaK [Balneolaceae bacterium]